MPETKPHTRNTDRFLLYMLPDEIAELTQLADQEFRGNRSEAARRLIKEGIERRRKKSKKNSD